MLFAYVVFAVVFASHGTAAPTSKNILVSRQFQGSYDFPPECANDCAEYVALANKCGGVITACLCNPQTLDALDICSTCAGNFDIASGVDPAEAEAFRNTTVMELVNGCTDIGFPITTSTPPSDATPVNGNTTIKGTPASGDPVASPPAKSDVVRYSGSERVVASNIVFGIVLALVAAGAGSLVLV